MERLLKDASAIAGVEFNIDSYADVISAIHVMQESMDITGTTMKEGSSTISGSINQLKGAWDNFLTALGDGGKTIDMDATINALFESLGAVASNVIPALETVATSIATQLPEIFGRAFEGLQTVVADSIRNMFGEETAAAFEETMGGFNERVTGALEFVKNAITDLMPMFQEIFATVSEIFPEVQETITSVFDTIGEVAQTVWPTVKEIIKNAVDIIKNVIETAWPIIKKVVETVMTGIKVFMEQVWPVISEIVKNATKAISDAIEALKPIGKFIEDLFNNIKKFIEDPIGTAQKFIEDAMSTIQGIFDGLDFSLPSIALPHFNVSGGEFPWGIGGAGYPPEFSVDWYGRGGFANEPTLNGYGERGLELYWPGYSPYFDMYAKGIAEHMPKNNDVDIHDCVFNVREESDIRRVAEELNRLIDRQNTGALA